MTVTQTGSAFQSEASEAFQPAPGGIVEMVDHLLTFCKRRSVKITHEDDHCVIDRLIEMPGIEPVNFNHYLHRSASSNPRTPQRTVNVIAESVKVPLPSSVFRAMLSRIAVLTSPRDHDAAPLYGGTGEFDFLCPDDELPTRFRVHFSNTVGAKFLEIDS